MNTEFEYMYRDASNYKAHASVVLVGEMTDELRHRMTAAFDNGEYFIADQIGLTDARVADPNWSFGRNKDDHCWNEFDDVSSTEAPATDERTVEEFVTAVEAVNGKWRDTDDFNNF